MPTWIRIAFRFCFLYFGLYCLSTQIVTGLAPLPNVDIPDPSALWPLLQIISWAAAHVFHDGNQLVFTGSGSGDKTVDWILISCLLVFALVGTGVWSVLDRRREYYAQMHKWFRLFIRIALAGQMFGYGWAKAVPLQMPFPFLTKLVEHFGDFSPMGVLWFSTGASPRYEIFAGCAELLAGLLLVLPRTTMLGALISLADMTYVFLLNMTYDVPVKLLSFHLILLSLFLLAPDARRLMNVFLLNRLAEPSTHTPLFSTQRTNRLALGAQLVIGIWLLGMNAYGSWQGWSAYGGARPKSLLYGIWDVEEFSSDGQVRSPLLTDYGRWRRVIFDFPEQVAFQRMDDSFQNYGAAIDGKGQSLVLTKRTEKDWKARFRFERRGTDGLDMDGDMGGHRVRMKLRLLDRGKFLLVSRGFHWIQEYPFNR